LGFAMLASHTIEPLDASNCRLTLEFTFSGVLSGLVALFADSLTQRYMATEIQTLKKLAETAHAGASV